MIWDFRGPSRMGSMGRSRTRLSCASAPSDWCASTRPSTARSGRRSARSPRRWDATPRRCDSGFDVAERDRGARPGLTTDERDRLKALERENRELRQANEILRKASAYFAQAELDRRFKP